MAARGGGLTKSEGVLPGELGFCGRGVHAPRWAAGAACGGVREGSGCGNGELEGGGVRGGIFAGARAGGAACEQGVDGGDAAPCAEWIAGDGGGFEVAGGEPGGGAAEVDGEVARGGSEGKTGSVGGGGQGAAAEGEEVEGDEGENGGGEAAAGGDEKAAGPRGRLIGGRGFVGCRAGCRNSNPRDGFRRGGRGGCR